MSLISLALRGVLSACVLFLSVGAPLSPSSAHANELAAANVEAIALEVEPPGVSVANLAASQAGAPYAWGGSSPYGFDCTGFVQWVYRQFGVELPRTEAGQWASGMPVGAENLEPGDILIFANTYRAGLSHVGIYLGEGLFVHAVDPRRGVMISVLWSEYWTPRFVGASRPLGGATLVE